MPVFRLGKELAFPPAEWAGPDGLLGVGGDLSSERLLLAYSQGIFPWHEDAHGPWWYSPDPRMVLLPGRLHVAKSLRKTLRQGRFRLSLDQAFPAVIGACAETPRRHEDATWISPRFQRAYTRLHRQGWAHSVEAWQGPELVGGLYGLSLGAAFFGESMFARVPDASKAAFVALVEQLARWGFTLVDCQVHTGHLERFGAEEWQRERYLAALAAALRHATRPGPWTFDASPSS